MQLLFVGDRMTSYSTTHKSVDLVYCGVPLTVIGVTFYPALDSTDTDPAEPAWSEWERIVIGGVDCTDLFQGQRYDDLEIELTAQLEEAYA